MTRGKSELAIAITERDMALTVTGRMAELVMGGCDYDDIAQRLTDTYAEWLGVEQDWDNDEYATLNEIANDHLTTELA